MFSQVNIEVSVKTRLGVENPDEVIDLMNIYNAFPISEVIVHARVREDYYKRPVNQEAFAQCLAISKHPVCYNGDLFTAQDIENLTAKFPDIKAVMLGRGMIANPQLTEVFCGRKHMEIAPVLKTGRNLIMCAGKHFLMNCVMDMNISCPAEGMSCLS